MNISFLIKAVSVWIELTLIFIHMANPAEQAAIKPCSFGVSQCEFLCTATGFRFAICNKDTCSCFRYLQKIGPSIGCQLSCAKTCQTTNRGETGMCDTKEECNCYMEHEKMDFRKDRCLVTKKYCNWRCRNMGYTNATCADDFCICHDKGQRVEVRDYRKINCVIPRDYCHSRCVNATFKDGGYCLNADCVCVDGNDLYFSIGLEDTETLCDTCQEHCEGEWVAKGVCVNGDCICVNGDWYTVAFLKGQQSWGRTKDFCMKVCAQRDYHTKAMATGYSNCICSQDEAQVLVDLQDKKQKPLFKKKS